VGGRVKKKRLVGGREGGFGVRGGEGLREKPQPTTTRKRKEQAGHKDWGKWGVQAIQGGKDCRPTLKRGRGHALRNRPRSEKKHKTQHKGLRLERGKGKKVTL